MIKKIVTLGISLLVVSILGGVVFADSLKGGYAACLSEELFDEMISAIVKKDERGQQYLLKNGCVFTKKGIHIIVLDTSVFSGVAKVRAFVGDNAFILWTNIENIKRE